MDCPEPRLIGSAGRAPDEPLPEADAVVLTWTAAEWSALDQVFINHRYPRWSHDEQWQHGWLLFARDAPADTQDGNTGPLWGFYQLVEVAGQDGKARRVLLCKSNTHLAHPPWFAGLAQFVTHLVKETRAGTVYSIGTAGAGHPDQRLGEVVLTNSGHVRLEEPQNAGAGIDGQTFTSTGPFPATTLLEPAAAQLMSPLSAVVTYPRLEALLATLREQVPEAAVVGLPDLVTPAIDPRELHRATVSPTPGKPLLTTDFYYIDDGIGAGQWVVLEMDDAVVGYVAGGLGANYAFVRNVSDPVVPATTKAGTALPEPVRSAWSSLIYDDFGLYTSFNGAIATWASIAAQADG